MSKPVFNVRFDFAEVSHNLNRLRGNLRTRTLKNAARAVMAKLSEYIFARSKTRHKVAERYGVKPTGILEFIGNKSRGGGHMYWRGNDTKQTLFISHIPFIQKAFRALHITPKRASALTIPISRFSVHKRVRDLRASGWQVFRPKGKDILMGKKSGGTRVFKLYKLAQYVKIPRDAPLLPSVKKMDEWTRRAILEDLKK